MKRYFSYLLKKNLIVIAALIIFGMLIYVLPIVMDDYSFWNLHHPADATEHGNFYRYFTGPQLYYGNISIFLGFASIIVPMFVFSYKMNKRSVDMHYSLPMSKKNVLIAHFLAGLVLVYLPYTILYVLGFAAVATKVQWIYPEYYIPLYFTSLIPAFIIYAFSSFIYTRANTALDGVICVFGAIVLFNMMLLLLSSIFRYGVKYTMIATFTPFDPLKRVTSAFGKAIVSNRVDGWFTAGYSIASDVVDIISEVCWALIAIACTIGLITSEKNSKAENCGQISESIFCYKLQIPLFVCFLIATSTRTFGFDLFLFILVISALIVESIIYKRTVKVGWRFVFSIAISCVVGLLLGILVNVQIVI